MKKLMLVINPASGRGAYKNYFGEAMHALSRGGYQTSLYFTTGPCHATELVARYGADFDVVACIGGDGTLSEVVSGLMQLKDPPPLGYFPMGTTNDVATTIGLPKNDTVGAAKRIIEGVENPFDVGVFGEDKYFAYIAAFGIFTDVSYTTPQTQKKTLGHLAYVLQGMAQLPKLESVYARVEFDGGEVEGRFLYGGMSNSTSVAGLLKLPEEKVCLGDGMSELVLVRDPGTVEQLRDIITTVEGFSDIVTNALSQRYNSENIFLRHTRWARFTFEKPVAWTRDGEAGGECSRIELRNIKAPIRLIF